MTLPQLIDVNVAQQRFARSVIGWLYVGGPPLTPAPRVDVYRSFSITDRGELIGTASPAARIYVDEYTGTQAHWRTPYYWLELTNDVETRSYGPIYLLDGPDKIARMITRRMEVMLSNIGASPVLIYQAFVGDGGDRCPSCWDSITEAILFGNCEACGGTGYIGATLGYYSPVLTLMDIVPAQAIQTVEGVVNAGMTTTARMSNYPILAPGDIIRQVNRGILWRVMSLMPQRKDHALITQDPVNLRSINPGDIEADLTVPSGIQPLLRRRQVRTERILQDNVDGTPSYLEVRV